MKTAILVIHGRRMLVTLSGPHTPAVDLGPVPAPLALPAPPMLPDIHQMHGTTWRTLLGG